MTRTRLEMAMESLDLTPRMLAKEAGLSRSVVRDVIAGEEPSERTRCLIEAILGQPIWASQEQFQRERERRKLFGREPMGMAMRELQLLARRIGLQYAKEKLLAREALVNGLEKALRERATRIEQEFQEIRAAGKFFERVLSSDEWVCLECGTANLRPEQRTRPEKCAACGGVWMLPKEYCRAKPNKKNERKHED
jgi:hypothetical protein